MWDVNNFFIRNRVVEKPLKLLDLLVDIGSFLKYFSHSFLMEMGNLTS